ncbi:hypothetical protein TSAR_001362, partial [Trichomalopsis sarcophagae]
MARAAVYIVRAGGKLRRWTPGFSVFGSERRRQSSPPEFPPGHPVAPAEDADVEDSTSVAAAAAKGCTRGVQSASCSCRRVARLNGSLSKCQGRRRP